MRLSEARTFHEFRLCPFTGDAVDCLMEARVFTGMGKVGGKEESRDGLVESSEMDSD